MDATSSNANFATWLRQTMIDAGYKMTGQRAGGPSLLARQIGVHRATVLRWLDGESVPKADKIRALAEQFDVAESTIARIAGPASPTGHDEASEISDVLEPSPQQLFDGGLRNEHEEIIWRMKDVPWQARSAAINAMRQEERRMEAEKSIERRASRRPA